MGDLNQLLTNSIARTGIDSKSSQKWRILVGFQLLGLGRYEEAKELWEVQIDSYRRTTGEGSIEMLEAERGLALCLAHLGDYNRAREVLQHLYEAQVKVLPINDERLVWTIRNMQMIDEDFGERGQP